MKFTKELNEDVRMRERHYRYYEILSHGKIDKETFHHDISQMLLTGYLKQSYTGYIITDKGKKLLLEKPDYIDARYAVIVAKIILSQYDSFYIPGIIRLVDDPHYEQNYEEPWSDFKSEHMLGLSEKNRTFIKYRTANDFNSYCSARFSYGKVILGNKSLKELKSFVNLIDSTFEEINNEQEEKNLAKIRNVFTKEFLIQSKHKNYEKIYKLVEKINFSL